ncbi:MAG: glycosyltransferase family 39 protein [Caulobacteraceae bacterium]|nr:glycosyltransferase family 39 protein [Caulobacteraceae bacterium]
MSLPREAASRPSLGAPSRALLLILAAITLFRLWMAAAIPLTEDEAYYRIWAASPQFGYFDHPPMIAWWIHLGMMIAGDTALGVRLIPCLSCLVTSLLAYDLAGRIGASTRSAERAAIWCNATLMIGAGGLLSVPDAAAVPFWMLTLCCLARTPGRAAPGWWLGAGAAAGLACLSKYSALFLAPGVILWLAVTPGGLKALRRPWPWLAAAAAVAIFSVNIVWNADHHWMSFVKQFGRATPGHFAPRFLLELILGQALLLNPLITVFVVRAAPLAWRGGAERPDLRLPLATAAPFAAYLVLHALHDRVQAHWPVPLYPALAVCAAIAAEQAQGRWLGALRAAAAPFGLGLSALGLLHAAFPASDLRRGDDPAAAIRGWPQFAAEVERMRQAQGAAWVGTLSYGTTGQLSAQGALTAPVAQLDERQRYPAADRSWRADLTRPGLVVDLERRIKPDKLGACFGVVRPLGPLHRGKGQGHESRYVAFLVAKPLALVLAQGCAPAQ